MRRSPMFETHTSGAPVPVRPQDNLIDAIGELGIAPEDHDATDEDVGEDTWNTPDSPLQRYASSEHYGIGNEAFKALMQREFVFQAALGAMYEPTEGKIQLGTIALQPGALVSLFGDFYGDHKKPISFGVNEDERKERFVASYLTLANAPPKEVDALLSQIDEERHAIVDAIKEGKKPSIGLESHSDAGNKAYGTITKYSVLPFTWLYSRYIDLAESNFDHFGDQAILAYTAGHEVAIATAREAAKQDEPVQREILFAQAVAQELAACHFVTDYYSSGHMRTPRKGMWDVLTQKTGLLSGKVAGLLALEMHNEDNANGLNVYSDAYSEGWVAYGDDCYYDPENKHGRVQTLAAVEYALEDILDAFMGKNVTYKYKAFLPKLRPDNFSPMFKVEGNELKVRRELNNLNCTDYDVVTSPTKTLVNIKRHYLLKQNQNVLSAEQEAELSSLASELEELARIPDSKSFWRSPQ